MDQGFPGQHTTTTTVTTTTTTTQPNVRFDPSYARTLPGMLKIVQVVSASRFILHLYLHFFVNFFKRYAKNIFNICFNNRFISELLKKSQCH